MTSKDSPQWMLQEIYQTKAFDKLHQLVEGEVWRSFEQKDQHLLAELLVLHGEHLLEQKDEKVFDVFATATKIKPNDPTLYYVQGMLLSSFYFDRACACLEKATELEPGFTDAWLFWAKIVLDSAEVEACEELAIQAEQLFARAKSHISDDPAVESRLFWGWAMADSLLGRLHGEAVDFKKSVAKLSAAAALGLNDAEFWENYGQVVCELGGLINNPKALIEGRSYFEKALERNPDNETAAISLAFCCQKIYELYGKLDDFHRGCDAFENARCFEDLEKDSQFWLRWGLLLFGYGRQNLDVDKIEKSLDLFKEALNREPENSLILCKWAEAEMVLGMYTDRINHLKNAETRIMLSLKLKDNDTDAWYVYGTCLNEIGRYFSDSHYYMQAVEKFQYGLYLASNVSVSSNGIPLSYLSQGISLSYYALGDLKGDASLIELSIIYIEQAIENSRVFVPQLLNDWAISLMKMGELTANQSYLESAIQKLEEIFSSFNNEEDFFSNDAFDPEWLYNYGCALDFLGDFHDDASYYEKSIQALSKFLQIDSSYVHAHYNLASAYSHLGELVGDVECFHKAIEHYQRFLSEDREDELAWNDYGLTLLHLAELLHDPSLPNLSRVCFNQAEEKFLCAVSLGYNGALYNLACLYSLTGHLSQALDYLEKAGKRQVLPSIEEITEDKWLENLHHTSEFRHFLTNLNLEKDDLGN